MPYQLGHFIVAHYRLPLYYWLLTNFNYPTILLPLPQYTVTPRAVQLTFCLNLGTFLVVCWYTHNLVTIYHHFVHLHFTAP